MRTPASIKVVNYVEADYGACKPPLREDQRGDERSLDCVFALGKKSQVDVHVAEDNASHTRFSLYCCFPDAAGLQVHNREADLYLSRRELLALPSMIQAAIREGDKIGMFDRGPSLWMRRELRKGETPR